MGCNSFRNKTVMERRAKINNNNSKKNKIKNRNKI